jgi:hypothetical protein
LFNKAQTILYQFPAGRSGSYSIPSGVTGIGNWGFFACSSLKSVTIPSSVTNIGNDAFYYCFGVTNVVIGGNVTGIGNSAFFYCTSLKSVTIPNSVTSIGNSAFFNCSSLKNVTIGNSVTSIGNSVFYSCSGLTNVTIGNSVTSIGTEAFYSCSGMKSVTIPNSVTSIGIQAFEYCSGLTNVTIGNSVTNIGTYAFNSCANLHQAYFQGNAPRVNAGAASADTTVFQGESGKAYYVPGTSGWGASFGGWPTAGWYQPRPQILGFGYGFGVQSNGFQFTVSWATNTSVVVEASTNLQNWTPVITNTLISGTNAFRDSVWTNYTQRFYRVRSPTSK